MRSNTEIQIESFPSVLSYLFCPGTRFLCIVLRLRGEHSSFSTEILVKTQGNRTATDLNPRIQELLGPSFSEKRLEEGIQALDERGISASPEMATVQQNKERDSKCQSRNPACPGTCKSLADSISDYPK